MQMNVRFARLYLTVLLCTPAVLGQTRLVISQMYGGGGNTGALFTNDFVELYNPTGLPISLAGLSLQYAAATSASWNSVALPSVSVAPGHFFLIQAAAGTTVTNIPLSPAADYIVPATGSSGNALNFSATAGKIAIAYGTAALTAVCPSASAYVDFLGFGAPANCFEGTGPAPAPSNTTADIRGNVNVDNVNNASDFSTAAPAPRSSGSATVPVVPPTVAIHTIQGVKSTTAQTLSPYAGQSVTTTGVVTAVISNGFFIQARDADADTNPLTPEGMEIFTSTRPTVSLGNYVQVSGTVQTYPAVSVSHTPATELTSPSVTVLAISVPLPAPLTLSTAMLTPAGGLYQLTPYEGMRVAVPSLTSVSGTTGSISSANESAELATSLGYFYAVLTGTPRPFREPGIDLRDPAVPNVPANVAVFDDNPERILVDSVLAGGSSLEISTGAVLPNVTGVLDFTFSSDSFYDPSRLILDAAYDRTQVTPGMSVQPVPLAAATEFTVASYNIERFYNTNSADDLYFVPAGVNGYNGNSSIPTVSTGQTFISAAADNTAAAYLRRKQKLSLAIRTVLNSPDIVTLEEVENLSVANDIAAQINADAGILNLYTAYGTDNVSLFTQDGTGISVGFLVKNTVNALSVSQVGAGETFTPATTLTTLNDRPWLVLSAGIKRANAKDYPVTVIVNHMKAITGENSPTSVTTRLKKELQAEDIAKYIQTLQAAGRHVISGGDFNAFEFSDGYTDTLGTYTGVNVLPASQVVQPGVAGLVMPLLSDLALTLPANQRYSYQEDGSAQILDHMVVTPELVTAGAHLVYAHLNADFPLTAYNDATTPARTSDHDVPAGFFTLPAPVASASLSTALAFSATPVGVPSNGQVFTYTNTGETAITITGVTASGDFTVNSACPGTLAFSASCTVNVVFAPMVTGPRGGVLTVATSLPGTMLTANLTGIGLASPAPVYVADASRVQRFTLSGAFQSQFTITGNGRFVFGPSGLAADAQGDTFLTDGFNKNVAEFDSNGNFVRTFGSFGTGDGQFWNGLGGLAVDVGGNVLVADSGNDRIETFTNAGVYIGQFGTRGHGDGQFVNPVSVVTDAAGHVFVADSMRVQEFASGGQYVRQFSLTSGGGFVFGPGGMAMDASGNFFLTDTAAKNVTEFGTNGNVVRVLGAYGSGNGGFLDGLKSVAANAGGNVLVGDSGNRRVESFSGSGVYEGQFGMGGSGPGQFCGEGLFVVVAR